MRPDIDLTVVLAAVLVLCGACQPSADGPSPGASASERVESAALGVAFAKLPDAFTVAVNDGERLELAGPDGSRLEFVNGELDNSVNLVKAASDHEASFAGRPDGELKQRTEMQTSEGRLVYLSRGRYRTDAGDLEEESVLLLIHPRGDRQLTLRYVYGVTEDTSQEELRVRLEDELIAVFGELEASSLPGDEAGGDDG